MTHTYNITGMTCSGCVANVKSQLLKIGDVLSAEIQLAAPQATITMAKHVPTASLQQAIGTGKFTITDADASMAHAIDEDTAESTSYYPIFLIFGYIAGSTLLIQFTHTGFNFMQWMAHFMAGFFLVFSFFKLMNLEAFADGYSTYDVIAKKLRVYGYIYPFIELLLGIAYITDFQPIITNFVTLAVMSVSAAGVIKSLFKKTKFQCACLGTIIKLPLGKVTLFEDLLMVAMSIIMLSGYMLS